MTVSPTTLPLDLDPETFRTLGREMLNLAADWLENETAEPLLEAISGRELAALFDEAPPEQGMASAALFSELREKILPMSAPHPIRWVHWPICSYRQSTRTSPPGAHHRRPPPWNAW